LAVLAALAPTCHYRCALEHQNKTLPRWSDNQRDIFFQIAARARFTVSQQIVGKIR
jgi:hypothetical protein